MERAVDGIDRAVDRIDRTADIVDFNKIDRVKSILSRVCTKLKDAMSDVIQFQNVNNPLK